MIEVTCPHCSFSKEVDIAALPSRINKVTCPRCRESFPLQRQEEAVEQSGTVEQSSVDTPGTTTTVETETDAQKLPKAGFWIRFVATILDGFLVLVLQGILGGLLYLAGAFNGGANEGLALLVQIFTYLLSFVYYIFFTGYGGQTPGKMVLRIKVIRCDGSPINYLCAAFREVPAKFIAGIIFGIGYLMVAFDEQKQGLHDRMAKTYVIKL
jgi:uncharacterized RDD family membrane protein YckC